MMVNRILAVFVLSLLPVGLGAAVSVGKLDETLLDPAYPAMQHWAKAGVQVAIESRDARAVIRLEPGHDLAAAVAIPHRIVQLSAGNYRIKQTLRLADGVVLRGLSPQQTKIILTMRGTRPTAVENQFVPWTTGVLFESVTQSGVENLTVAFDDSLPAPPDPRRGGQSYLDNPGGQDDLHVVAVRLSGSQHCWLSNVAIQNSGQHPLVIESSAHVTIDGVEIAGTYNKGDGSGNLLISGSEYCLLTGLTVSGINHISFVNDAFGRPSRYNVLINSRIAVDVRFRNPEASHNLLQECVIEVPSWHDFPPISLGWNATRANAAANTNLIYFCTITRDFSSSRTRFSIADNPNKVYHILANSTLKGNVEVAGPAPKASTLWPVR